MGQGAAGVLCANMCTHWLICSMPFESCWEAFHTDFFIYVNLIEASQVFLVFAENLLCTQAKGARVVIFYTDHLPCTQATSLYFDVICISMWQYRCKCFSITYKID